MSFGLTAGEVVGVGDGIGVCAGTTGLAGVIVISGTGVGALGIAGVTVIFGAGVTFRRGSPCGMICIGGDTSTGIGTGFGMGCGGAGKFGFTTGGWEEMVMALDCSGTLLAVAEGRGRVIG